MITATFGAEKDGLLTGFCVRGHSGSAQAGQDIICASVSSAALMTANTITDILFLAPTIQTEDGYLYLKLSSKEAQQAAEILQGFQLHMLELSKVYPEFIKVERGAL